MQADSVTVQKWTEFVVRLLSASMNNRIIWKETAASHTILTVVGDDTVSLSRFEDERSLDFVFEILDTFEDKIDSFTQNDLDDRRVRQVGIIPSEGMNWHTVLDEFFRLQKRKISGADEALDRMIAELPEPPPVKGSDIEDDEIPF